MAKDIIPKEAAELAYYMMKIMVGDDKHKSDRPLDAATRARMAKTRLRLLFTNRRVHFAEAELAQARQQLRKDKEAARDATKHGRDGVYSNWGHKNAVLYDYGLKPSRGGRPKGHGNK